jgi:hypothetical protein
MAKAKYYESDLTKMMRELLEQKPHIVEDQKVGRALWWDKQLDLEMLRRGEQARVPQEPYVYQTKTDKA